MMASGLDLTYLQRDDGDDAAASSMGSGFRANTSDTTTNDTSYSNSRNDFAGDSSTGIGAEEEQRQQDVYRTLYDGSGAYMMEGAEVAANGGGSAMGDVPQQQHQLQQQHPQPHSQQTQTQQQQQQQQAGDVADDNMRPWTELKTKAGKERKRLPLACIVCRRKKIRCSGEKPACKHCYRSRIPCVYKVTTRKAAPRTDYMAMLDKRLKRMEERVMKAIPKDEPRDMAGIGRATVKPHPPGHASRPARAALKKRTATEAFSAELNEWTRSAGPGPIHQPAQAQSVPAAAPGNGQEMRVDMPPSLQPHMNTEHKLLSQGAEFLPSMELQEHLAEVFFDCVYGQSYLLLHKPSFMRKLKTDAVPPVLTLAICAVAARFSTHPDVNTEPAFLRGESWADAAADIALARHDQPNITILTVFLILGLHEFGACHGGRSWSFGGMALRMAYALQLHKELDRDPLGQGGNASELSCTDREIRRRTMWACILMDRYNSSGSQRPPIGNEKFLQIQLPIKESHFWREIPGPTEDLDGSVPNPVPEGVGQLSNPKNNMGISAYIIRGIMLWGKIVDYLNLGGKDKDPCRLWEPESGYNQLKRQLKEFSASLPECLIFNWENLQNYAVEKIANQFIFLHIVIHQNTMFLNRFAIPLSPRGRPPRDIPKQFLSEAGRAAVEAASHISMLIDQASGYMLTVPFAGYCAYAASTVHIWGIFSKNPQLEAASKENFRHTYKYLNKMKRYWGMFHYMVESAKERYRHFAEASLRGRIAPETGKDSNNQDVPIFQYGDWFDKYPHGVSKMRWEDPDVEVKRESGSDAVMAHQSDLQSVEEFFTSLSPVSPSEGPRKEAKRADVSTPPDKARRQLGSRGNNKSQSSNASTQSQSRVVPNMSSPERQQQQTPRSQPMQQPLSNPINSQISPQPGPLPNHVSNEYTHYNNPNMYHADPASFSTPEYKFHPHPDPLPQLDRQLVYDAYAGVEAMPQHPIPIPSSNNPPIQSHHPAQQPQPQASHGPDPNINNSYWNNNNNNYHSYDMHPPMNWNGELIQSSAWFLPFNLDPTGLDGHVSQPGAPAGMPAGPSHSPPNPVVSSGMTMGDGSYYGAPAMMHPVGMGLGMGETMPGNIPESIRERVG